MPGAATRNRGSGAGTRALGPWTMNRGPLPKGPWAVDKACQTGRGRCLFRTPKQYTGPLTQTGNPLLPDHSFDDGADRHMKDNALSLPAIGLATCFGPDWPAKRCLAKTLRGTECQRPTITGSGRCRLHECVLGGAACSAGCRAKFLTDPISYV